MPFSEQAQPPTLIENEPTLKLSSLCDIDSRSLLQDTLTPFDLFFSTSLE